MPKKSSMRRIKDRVVYFFPFQLVVLHLKKNHLMLLVWVVLFGFITQVFGTKYGIPYVFLFPEYFGRADMLSFLLLGFGLGGFITGFNLFTYSMHGFRFPFVATLARPFLKFSVNNGLIPVVFVLTYLWQSARLQLMNELIRPGQVLLHLLAFLAGIGLFLLIAVLYFMRTNTDAIKLSADSGGRFQPEPVMEDIIPSVPPDPQQQRKANRWLRRVQRTEKWRVVTYLSWPLQLKLARSVRHYDKQLLRAVLWQNHINGSIFELVMVISFLGLGAFSTTPFFAIPAGASIFLLFTMVLMLLTAVASWVKGWFVSLIIGIAVLMNMLSLGTQSFVSDSQAYGLDYLSEPAPYTREVIRALATDRATAEADATAHEATLNTWLKKNRVLLPHREKPPLVIINTSGGGSRAMLWTFRCLQAVDSVLEGQLIQRSALMTGSSGGLIGAAYYRQLYMAALRDSTYSPLSPTHLQQMAADILNPVVFNLVTNDMFIRYRRVHDGDRSYTLDRGYAFEHRLDSLTLGLLNIRLNEMQQTERTAEVPLLVISPTILNDGRRLLISSLPCSYLSNIAPNPPVTDSPEAESVEFQRLFKGQDPGNLKLITALRMNATFPYITPVVTMPSTPRMNVLDAGARDNYGYRTTLSFLYTFRHWLQENVSRVVVIDIRDRQREMEVQPAGNSLLARLVSPIGGVYDNFIRIQDQDFDLAVKTSDAWMPVPMEVVDLQLWQAEDEAISLSWHLTAIEQERVLAMIESPINQAALERLQELILGTAQ